MSCWTSSAATFKGSKKPSQISEWDFQFWNKMLIRTSTENDVDVVWYHTWFVNPFIKPAGSNTLLETYWTKAATKLGWRNMDMRRPAITFISLLSNEICHIWDLAQIIEFIQLNSRESSGRSHLVYETRNLIQDLYNLSNNPATDIKATITYLLEIDRFPSHPSKQEVSSLLISFPIRRQNTYSPRNVASDLVPLRLPNSYSISGFGVGICRKGLTNHSWIVVTTY